jgi:hypothetical protein
MIPLGPVLRLSRPDLCIGPISSVRLPRSARSLSRLTASHRAIPLATPRSRRSAPSDDRNATIAITRPPAPAWLHLVRRSHDVGHDAGDERFPNREEPVHASSGFRRGCSVAKGAISTAPTLRPETSWVLAAGERVGTRVERAVGWAMTPLRMSQVPLAAAGPTTSLRAWGRDAEACGRRPDESGVSSPVPRRARHRPR